MAWLSAFASRFEHYELLGGKVVWTSANPTTAGGALAFSIDYDVLDSAPTSQLAMLNGSNVVNGAVWDQLTLPIKPQNIVPRRKFNRVGFSAPTLSDSRMYDSFDLYFHSTGSPAGYLTVEYTVKFSTPQITPNGSDSAESDSILSLGTSHFPKVDVIKTAVGAGVRLREATAVEGSLATIPVGGAVLETVPNWSGLIEAVSTNSATKPCSDLGLARITGLYPDLDWAPSVSALDDIIEDADGRSAKTWRVKTGPMPGIFKLSGVNAAETPLSMLIRSASGAYESLML
jgi:hypothetical protein